MFKALNTFILFAAAYLLDGLVTWATLAWRPSIHKMAQVSSHPLPPTPPAAVYSPNPVRSQSPQIVDGQRPSEPRRISSGNILQSRDLSSSPQLPKTSAFRAGLGRHIPAQVQIYPPDSSPYVEESNDTDHLSPILSRFPRRQVSSDNMDGSNSRVVSYSSQVRPPSSTGSKNNDESQTESHEPLQYHHQILQDQERDLAKRASKLTIGAHSNGSTGDLSHLHMRSSSYLGADLARPDSGFSSQSDQRGRTLSPHVSPARASSRQSKSPDGRFLGYVDLLNVPYPQPAPSGAENLMNEGLRTVIGENASLLSTRKTLDMYRMNVKKTNDPAIQYEFAIFMISAAQDEALQAAAEEERSTAPQKSGATPPIKSDLLKEAKHILQKLCDRSYPFAQYYLADGYASGLFSNGKPDLEKSFPLFLAASKHGHAEAGYRTALCYEYGWGCRVDAAKAVQFYQQAASKNHPGAMLRLGRACLTGEMGLVKKYREGIRWLKRGSESADFQYNQAPFDLACLHEEGYGPDVFKDEPYAAQLYTKAAALGHKEAAFRLGEAYEYGQISCPRDPALSVHFYTGAAELGHPQAQMALCAWYMVGVEEVLEKDEGEAYEWARKAAELGLAKAQYTVGYFTEMGIGCRRDPLEANVWYVRAADQGEERAKHRISAIRAASAGADPMIAAQQKKKKTKKSEVGEAGEGKRVASTPVQGKHQSSRPSIPVTDVFPETDKKKRFGLF